MTNRPLTETLPRLAEPSGAWSRWAEALRPFAAAAAGTFEMTADELADQPQRARRMRVAP
jgi:hypothetical protein